MNQSDKDSCFRVVTSKMFPMSWVEKLPNGELKLHGIAADIIEAIGNKYGKCFQVGAIGDVTGSKLPNGTWIGNIGQLLNNEMDILGTFMQTSVERRNVVPNSEWIYMEDISFLYKKPKEVIPVDGFLKPYKWTMWFWILGFFLVTSFLLHLILKVAKRLRSNDDDSSPTSAREKKRGCNYLEGLSSACLNIWAMLLLQGVSCRNFFLKSSAILYVTWLFGSFLVATVYKNNLIARMTAPIVKYPFTNLDEYLAQNELKAINGKMTVLYQQLAKEDPNSKGGKLFKTIETVKDWNSGQAKLDEGEYAILQSRDVLLSGIELKYVKTGTCPYHLLSYYLQQFTWHMAFSKEFPLIEEFNKEIRRLREAGIINFWKKKYHRHAYICTIAKDTQSLRPLNINDFHGVFLLWFAGMALACVVFLLEILCATLRGRE